MEDKKPALEVYREYAVAGLITILLVNAVITTVKLVSSR